MEQNKFNTLDTFESFGKIPRYSRGIVITEKLDGTNAQIAITEDGKFLTGSRNRWITPEDDNYGFSRWAHENKEELMRLGVGRHYGEWWGAGIQRGYHLSEKRFSLFNTGRWSDDAVRPTCCHVVPVLWTGQFRDEYIDMVIEKLKENGSFAVQGFIDPEGIVIYHKASNSLFKKTLIGDDSPKSTLDNTL